MKHVFRGKVRCFYLIQNGHETYQMMFRTNPKQCKNHAECVKSARFYDQKLEKFIKFEKLEKNGDKLGITIKELDENVFRNFKAEAVRRGFKIGEATTEAFRLWILFKKYGRVRDRARMNRAARHMDELRMKSPKGWSGVKEIRKWRELRK